MPLPIQYSVAGDRHVSFGARPAARSDVVTSDLLARAYLDILARDEGVHAISDRARLSGDNVEYWSRIVNSFLELRQGIEERPGVAVIEAPVIRT